MALPAPGKPFSEFQADDANCRQWAAQQIGQSPQETANQNTVTGAVVAQSSALVWVPQSVLHRDIGALAQPLVLEVDFSSEQRQVPMRGKYMAGKRNVDMTMHIFNACMLSGTGARCGPELSAASHPESSAATATPGSRL